MFGDKAWAQSVTKSSSFRFQNKFQIRPVLPTFNATTMVPAPLLSPDGCRASYGLSASTLTPYSLFSTQQHQSGAFRM